MFRWKICRENNKLLSLRQKQGSIKMDSVKEATGVLASVDLNSAEKTCGFCGKEKPSKKCSKSHSRCKGILFCDKKCETQSHKAEKEAAAAVEEAAKIQKEDGEEGENDALEKQMQEAAKAEKAQKKKAKKAAKKDGRNNQKGGEFWWNNSVYASW